MVRPMYPYRDDKEVTDYSEELLWFIADMSRHLAGELYFRKGDKPREYIDDCGREINKARGEIISFLKDIYVISEIEDEQTSIPESHMNMIDESYVINVR